MIGIDEKRFIRDGFRADIRSDGRACNDSRPLALSLGDLQQCSGSARCTLGSTDVIVGVKAELGSPLPDSPDCGGVQITVECSPCAGAVSQGRAGEAQSFELAKCLERTLNAHSSGRGSALDLRALSIVSGRTCWMLCIDALVLTAGGSLLDALSIAVREALSHALLMAFRQHSRTPASPWWKLGLHKTLVRKLDWSWRHTQEVVSYVDLPGFYIDRCGPKQSSHDVQAALQNTRIPLVEVGATEDPAEEPDLELDDDPANAKLVDVSRVPIIVTVCQADDAFVIDTTMREEEAADQACHIAVSPAGNTCGIFRGSNAAITPFALQEMMSLAQKRGPLLLQAVSKLVASAATSMES